jgi:hypothetical protein
MNAPAIKPHPQGGLTIAVPVPGSISARVYIGRFSTRRAAVRALQKERTHANLR